MRKVLLALLLIAPAAYAQPKTSFSVFLSQVNIAYSPTTGHHWYSDYGAGVETVFTPRFSLHASVTSERRSSRPYVVDETGYSQPAKADFMKVRGAGTDYHFNSVRAWRIVSAVRRR